MTLRPGVINFALGGCIAAGLSLLVVVGATVAHKVPARTLKIVVCAVLIVASVALLSKLLVDEYG